MEQSRKKLDVLMMSWSTWMGDRRPRPLSTSTRYNYVVRVQRAITIANDAGQSLLTGDLRTMRLVLGRLSPNPSTQNGYMSALDCFFRYLQDQGLRKDNPIEKLGRPPQRAKLPRPMRATDCVAYLEAAVRLGVWYQAIAVLGLYMGLRRAEMASLQWVMFFEADGIVWCDLVRKGGKNARLPVHRQVLRVLRLMREDHNDATWLFPSPAPHCAGRPVSWTWLHFAHKKILNEAELDESLTLHQLRHSYATYLKKSGADMAEIQDLLSHSDPKSTRVYLEVLRDDLAKTQGRLDFSKLAHPDEEPRPANPPEVFPPTAS